MRPTALECIWHIDCQLYVFLFYQNDDSPLCMAAAWGSADDVRLLLQNHADVDETNKVCI